MIIFLGFEEREGWWYRGVHIGGYGPSEITHEQTTKEGCQCNLMVDKGPFDTDIADIR